MRWKGGRRIEDERDETGCGSDNGDGVTSVRSVRHRLGLATKIRLHACGTRSHMHIVSVGFILAECTASCAGTGINERAWVRSWVAGVLQGRFVITRCQGTHAWWNGMRVQAGIGVTMHDMWSDPFEMRLRGLPSCSGYL